VQDKRREAERKRELAAREAAAAEEEKRLRAEAEERTRKREAAAAAAAEAARLSAEEEERARVAQAMEEAKTKRSLRAGNLAMHGTKRGVRALPCDPNNAHEPCQGRTDGAPVPAERLSLPPVLASPSPEGRGWGGDVLQMRRL
jgi:hypothetical protein